MGAMIINLAYIVLGVVLAYTYFWLRHPRSDRRLARGSDLPPATARQIDRARRANRAHLAITHRTRTRLSRDDRDFGEIDLDREDTR